MRLWHQELIPYLSSQHLNGQHRECCALRGDGWGRAHSTVNYVFDHNPMRLVNYHLLIIEEKIKRGHTGFERKWYDPWYRGKNCRSWSPIDLDYELFGMEGLIYSEHNATYLSECLANLRDKGYKVKYPELPVLVGEKLSIGTVQSVYWIGGNFFRIRLEESLGELEFAKDQLYRMKGY